MRPLGAVFRGIEVAAMRGSKCIVYDPRHREENGA